MKNFLVYLIGTSGSGKTTIGEALERELNKRGNKNLQFIDGDVIRAEFGNIFGYTLEERMKCNQAVRVVLKYLLNNSVSVILAQVCAYQEIRDKMRKAFEEQYVEIYVKCSYEECARRDVKGYYKRQQENTLENLNGANDVFEEPKHSEIVIDTEQVSIEEAVNMIIHYLEKSGYIV